MNIKQITLRNLEMLHTVFRGYRSHDGFGNWFRGQADESWKLLPKAGRAEYGLSHNHDLGIFNRWRQQAIAYYSLPENELEQLAIAQHHGLATRLLDWSKNPLVACFFTCSELPQHDGAVYIYEAPEKYFKANHSIENLKEVHGVFGYIPTAISPRILNQKGLFTVHCDPTQSIEITASRFSNADPNLVQLIIPATLKTEILHLIADYGIDRSILFPDLDGLSAHINNDIINMTKS